LDNNNNNNKENEIYEYMDILVDAAKQRNPKFYKRAQSLANCIYEMIALLRKYKVHSFEDTIHVLTSVLVMPIQILEPDPDRRSLLMRELSSAFVNDILDTQTKDTAMRGSEMGDELDKVRRLSSFLKF